MALERILEDDTGYDSRTKINNTMTHTEQVVVDYVLADEAVYLQSTTYTDAITASTRLIGEPV